MLRCQPAQSEADKLRRHQHILINLGLLATRTMPLNRFLKHAARELARALEVSNVKIMRFRPESGDLLLIAGVGWKGGIVGRATLPVDLASPPGRAFQIGEPVIIDDIRENPDFRTHHILKQHNIVSLVNVPIMLDRAAWGVLEVDNNEPRIFNDDTSDFLLAVAVTIASAIQREQAQVAHAEALTQAALEAQRRDLLLSETQHRVKNYFQLILAMIAAQRPKATTDEARLLIDRILERIMAITLAHEQLSPDQGEYRVNLAAYLRALCGSIQAQQEDILVKVQADDIAVSADQAVPVGLIVNELVTNSIKHAFNGREEGNVRGTISVRLSVGLGSNRILLVVSDDGHGFDPGVGKGSGLNLVRSLARQIGGTVNQKSSPAGTTTCMAFMAGE